MLTIGSLTLLSLLLIFSKNVNSEDDEDLSRKKRIEEAFERCLERIKCPNDGKNIIDVPEKEQHETYHCRQHRYMKCMIEPDPDQE